MQQNIQKTLSHRPSKSSIESLKSRLRWSVGLLILCLVLISGVGVLVSLRQQQLGDQKVTLHNHISQIQQAMLDQETGLRGYITTNNLSFMAPYRSGQLNYNNAILQMRQDSTQANFQATSNALKHVETAASNWQTNFAAPQITNMQNGHFQLASSEPVNTRGKNLFDAFRQSINQLQNSADSDLAALQARTNTFDLTSLIILLLLTLLAVIWIWYNFSRYTSIQRKHLEIIKETASAFGQGNLDARVEGINDADLHNLGSVFNHMASLLQDQQTALNDRDILEQVSQLNSILTDSLDLTELMQNFLRTSFSLLDLQVGALYLYEPRAEKLNLFTSRGLPIEEMQSSFALGEGLVGWVAAERKPLTITQPKQDKSEIFKIKTMLGTVVPSSLYHLPLIRGNELLGVLGLGSMYPMKEQTRNVLNVVASNVAAAISNTQAYGHIQKQARELTESGRQQEQSNQALRRQRDELTVLNSALEEANRARSQFLSTMSHELRTPLTSIIGFSQMLLRPSAKPPLTDRQSNNVNRILKNAQHLLTLINDVLDLAKVEAGRMDVNATEVNLPELLTSLIDETRSIAVERKLSLKISVEDGIETLETDPLKLRQILLNLISNALKFTEKGGVTVSATRRTQAMVNNGDSIEAEQIAIAVHDTGIGIPLEKQEHIFEAFYQVDNSNSRNYGGTGLGLSIVRELTTLLGGRVEIESKVDQGTTFTIVLPMHVHDRQSIHELRLNTLHSQVSPLYPDPDMVSPLMDSDSDYEPNEDDQPFLVVAIDDNPDVLQLISASLEQSPYRVVGVQDSTQAVSVVQELLPRAITLDVMMPKINGWQILHQLKSNPATASIPVILLTVLEDRSAGYVLGADEYLVKPISRDALLNTLHQLTTYLPETINQAVSQAEAHQENAMSNQSSGRSTLLEKEAKPILLVHNEHNLHQFIERAVKENGYNLATTSESQDVIELIEQAPPDMLMLVVQMDNHEKEALKNLIIVDQAANPSTPSISPPSEQSAAAEDPQPSS